MSCPELGVEDLPGPNQTPDQTASPWQVEPSNTALALYGVWGAPYSSGGVLDGGMMVVPDGGGGGGTPDMGGTIHTRVWAVGASGIVLIRASVDGTWGHDSGINTNGNTLYAIAGRAYNDMLVVGDTQTAGQWNGSFWSVSYGSSPPTPPPFLAVQPQGSVSYLAVGKQGAATVLTYQSRAAVNGTGLVAGQELTSAAFFPGGTQAVVGASSGSTFSYQNGSGFTGSTPVTQTAIRAMWARTSTDAWLVGDGGLLMHYKDAPAIPVVESLT